MSLGVAGGILVLPSPLAGEGGRASRTGEGSVGQIREFRVVRLRRSPLTRLEDSPPSPARGEGNTWSPFNAIWYQSWSRFDGFGSGATTVWGGAIGGVAVSPLTALGAG